MTDLSPRSFRTPRASNKEMTILAKAREDRLKADVVSRLTTYVMDCARNIDEERVEIARGLGPEMNAVLIEFELTGFQQLKKLQRNFDRD